MIINDCMSPQRNRSARILHATRVIAVIALGLAANALHAADKAPPPAKIATEYAAHDRHPDEHVTVAAEPCEDEKDCPFFRLKYQEHGLLPVRVIITNDSDHALSLDEARMQFISAANDKLPAATPDDINRRLFTIKNARGTKIPVSPGTYTAAETQLSGYAFEGFSGAGALVSNSETASRSCSALNGFARSASP